MLYTVSELRKIKKNKKRERDKATHITQQGHQMVHSNLISVKCFESNVALLNEFPAGLH